MRPPVVRRLGALCRSDSATTTIEFLVALPLLAATFAVLVQFLLLLHSRTIVDYAAFGAARSAAVWLPTEPAVVGPVHAIMGTESEAMRRIHSAAALACVPLSPPLRAVARGAFAPDPGFEDLELRLLGSSTVGGETLPMLATLGRSWGKFEYARRAVRVDLEIRVLAGGGRKRTRVVEATITFKQHLFLPIAADLFGRDEAPTGLEHSGGRYTDVQATYELPLEEEVNAPLRLPS